jgi:hypothetical protein
LIYDLKPLQTRVYSAAHYFSVGYVSRPVYATDYFLEGRSGSPSITLQVLPTRPDIRDLYYFRMSSTHLIVCNYYKPWFRHAYPLSEICWARCESAPKASGRLAITMKGFYRKAFIAAPLSEEDWTVLLARFRKKGIFAGTGEAASVARQSANSDPYTSDRNADSDGNS